MAAKKVGALIKEARTAAGLTQEQLARKVKECSAADLGRAERGEKELTQEQLKQIAKATGVTQKSLLEAAKGTATKKTTSTKTSSTKASSAKTSTKTSTAKKTTSSTKKTSAAKEEFKLTATEKKLVELYRKADSKAKEAAMKTLKGEASDDLIGGLLGSAISAITGGKLG